MTDAWGIVHEYEDAFGERTVVPEETIEALRESIGEPVDDGPLIVHPRDRTEVGRCRVLVEGGGEVEVEDRLPPDLPLGYHTLIGDGEPRRLIVSPKRCYLADGRKWGWAVQLYATRSRLSWGMGDFGDLDVLAGWSKRIGADMMLVNPLSSVAPSTPRQPSPYYPATRRFLDPIYLRIEEVVGSELAGEELTRAAAAGRALNDDPLVHRDEVWALKEPLLERLWEITPMTAFEHWLDDQGPDLERFAVWSTIAERHGGDWRTWPEAFREPSGRAVGQIASEHQDRVRFHQWLQWLCRTQLDRAAEQITLIQDLPIGIDPGGADAWAWQDELAFDVNVGAPPDEFNTHGQEWGLPPFVPHRLRAADYEPFIQTIRANLAAGGALRIDHVLGLFRLFWIPAGAEPAAGAYVRYPSRDLLDILALESHRARATIVGEDLGTVEPGVRDELAARRILSYRVLWFEDDEPASWPELAMASVTTHDLSTVMGLWRGTDLEEQDRLELEPNVESTRRIRSRVAALADVEESSRADDVVEAVHRRLAEAPSRLLCATLEDATRAERRPNIPGSDPHRPNWSIALEQPIEEIVDDPLTRRLAEMFDEAIEGERPKETDDDEG